MKITPISTTPKLMNKRWHPLHSLSLRPVLVLSFIIPIVGAVGVTGYLSFGNSQKAVNNLANQLTNQVNERIEERLNTYLGTAHTINKINLNAVKINQLDLNNFEQLQEHFWQQYQIFPSVSIISYANERGEFLAVGNDRTLSRPIVGVAQLKVEDQGVRHDYLLTNQGKSRSLFRKIPNYDPRNLSWYKAAKAAGQSIWSPVYFGVYADVMAINACTPVYQSNGELRGALFTYFILGDISQFLEGLKVSSSGQAFIIERSGDIVATSTQEKLFKKLPKTNKKKRLSGVESSNYLTRITIKSLINDFGDIHSIPRTQKLIFINENEKAFVHVTPYHDNFGLDWLIVIVVPESDFMAEINANTRSTIILCLIALFIAIGVGILIAGWVINPLLKLNQAAKDIAQGNFTRTVEVQRADEVGELAIAFNEMAVKLSAYSQNLEALVAERTLQLEETNLRLEKEINEAHQAKLELAKAKEKAEEANRAKSVFLANMSHELRTPLNGILGFSQLLVKESVSQKQRQKLETINRNGEYLLKLINDVLSLAKIEANRLILEENNFDFYALLDDLDAMFSLRAKHKGILFIIDCGENVPQWIRGDDRKLRQVLTNLSDNALKFTTEGNITLRVRVEEISNSPLLHFEVADTGSGISSTEIDSIFEAFIQSETGRNSTLGSGLGLTLCRRFVELMGGKITVSSLMEKGTTFQFYIPLKLADLAVVSQESKQEILGLVPAQPQYRILVVDDVESNRELLREWLTAVGFEIQEADNGEVALQQWESYQPHLIWMDIQMPIMDGIKATQLIREIEQNHLNYDNSPTKIIAITASVFEEDRSRILQAGFDDFVGKPCDINLIFEKLKQHLGVKYIYRVKKSEFSVENISQPTLESLSLDFMPQEWLTQLNFASRCGDPERIEELLEQIPEPYQYVKPMLLEIANKFEFKKIIALIKTSGASL